TEKTNGLRINILWRRRGRLAQSNPPPEMIHSGGLPAHHRALPPLASPPTSAPPAPASCAPFSSLRHPQLFPHPPPSQLPPPICPANQRRRPRGCVFRSRYWSSPV